MSDTYTFHELRASARQLFEECDPLQKTQGVHLLVQKWTAQEVVLDPQAALTTGRHPPGRPGKPELVPPQAVKRRGMNTQEGRAIAIHALTHIEFSAINLALDAIWRYTGMPDGYYADWLKVADEEASHFMLLAGHLNTLGYSYGHFPAHDGLWEMADKTRSDILARIALVPRTMEARGLDATPKLRAKFAQAGDHKAAAILDIILRDEIGHVATGNRWFNWLCTQRGVDPVTAYDRLAREYRVPELRGPFNLEARRAAGFSEAELQKLGRT